MDMNESISVNKFYGWSDNRKRKICNEPDRSVVPFKSHSLLCGPTLTWKVFKRQADALDFMRRGGFGLMTFAFQTDETRLFLVAHPDVFWHYDGQRPADQRCSYEVIPEGTVCKLYLDLEYDKLENPEKDEHSILESFINLLAYLIKKCFSVTFDRSSVLTLDSSTPKKFSSHVIFDIPFICFLNNWNAGNFVKFVCSEIMTSLDRNSLSPELIDGPLCTNDLRQFIVKDSKGKSKLFCDECVYSKNRHFRLFKSTKKGKNSPLNLYQHCNFKYTNNKDIFLSSLITYVNGVEKTRVLQFGETKSEGVRSNNQSFCQREFVNNGSCFPKVDDFIKLIIKPKGRIYRSIYFSTSNIILYDIVGYRYCANIGREHKSNNIKYIVDLTSYTFYQKCHDYECSSFRSESQPLPFDLIFSLSDHNDLISCDSLGSFELSQTVDLLEAIEHAAYDPSFSQDIPLNNNQFSKFPSFGLPDESFSEIAEMLDC